MIKRIERIQQSPVTMSFIGTESNMEQCHGSS